MPSLPAAREGMASTYSFSGIYNFGGRTGPLAYVNTAEMIPVVMHTGGPWQSITPMPTARAFHAACHSLNGRIYVFGGRGLFGYLNTVEVYDPTTNTWTTRAPMPTARGHMQAVLGDNGRIFVLGGYNGSTTLNTVEAYNPATNTWTTLSPMSTPRADFGADSNCWQFGSFGRVLVAGGRIYGSPVPLGSAECYDLQTGTWSARAPLNFPRYGHGMAQDGMGGEGMLVAGGFTAPGVPTASTEYHILDWQGNSSWFVGMHGPLNMAKGNISLMAEAPNQGFLHMGAYVLGGEDNLGNQLPNLEYTMFWIVLPQDELSFSAERSGASVELNWEIQDPEILSFQVERGASQNSFAPIGDEISAGGNRYYHRDDHPLQGENFYRLKAKMQDGSQRFSEIVAVEMPENTLAVSVFPNPATDIVRMEYFVPREEGSARFQLLSLTGAVLAEQTLDANALDLPVADLPRGIYFIRVSTRKDYLVRKLILE